jgi:predicted metal-dependent hydrolase
MAVQPSLPFDLPYRFVRNRRARRYVIRVGDDGAVRIAVPPRGTLREAAAFADRERAWIEKEQKRAEQVRRLLAVPPVVEREVRERAARELPDRLLAWAARLGLTVRRISVRNQRSLWGSCSPSGHICLNWRLVLLPAFLSDYVMVHELMHLVRLDHSPRFWKLVGGAYPRYLEARLALRGRPPCGSGVLPASAP